VDKKVEYQNPNSEDLMDPPKTHAANEGLALDTWRRRIDFLYNP
jgi:hypothetical protein